MTCKGQAVLTTKAIAEVLGTDANNVKHHFSYNRNDFKEGVDYHKITAKEAKGLGFLHIASKMEGLASHSSLFRYSGTGMALPRNRMTICARTFDYIPTPLLTFYFFYLG